MSDSCVVASGVTKSFRVLKYNKTTLQALKRWWTGDNMRRQHAVLADISFRIRMGEKVALVGRNGCGKSTLLRIIAGIYDADKGDIQVAEPPCVLLDANVGIVPILSVVDNLFLFGAVHGIDRALLEERLDAVLNQAGLSELRFAPFRDLSKGQRQRFALSIFLQTPSAFVIFDEALTNLDIQYLRECEAYFAELKRSDKTVLMTSHESAFLRRYCDRALWLDAGQVRLDGEANAVIDAYERSF